MIGYDGEINMGRSSLSIFVLEMCHHRGDLPGSLSL